MSIACFGASVTQQNNGYSDKLSILFKKKINKFGYGGEHLFPSGMIFIDEVLKTNPNVCFIDWFSTGYLNLDNNTIDALNTINYKFSKANCKLIFLFFYR